MTDAKYPLSISENDGQSVDAFLARYKPSWNIRTVKNAEGELVPTDWIWCRTAQDDSEDKTDQEHMDIMRRAGEIEGELRRKCAAIMADDNIPTHASKARGRSKAQLREEQYDKTRAQFKHLAYDCDLVSGKFLFYPTDVACDAQWERTVKALLLPGGALRDSPAFCAKIATSMDGDIEGWPTRVICIYIKNGYDFAAVKETYIKLVRGCHLVANSFKPDIFTYAGIMTGHPSGMRPTVYDLDRCMSKAQRSKFFNGLKAPPAKKTLANESKRRQANGGFEDESGSETETEDEGEPPAEASETEDEIEPPPKRSKTA